MKKALCLLIGALCVVALAFGFTACENNASDKNENEITSLTMEGWTYGETANTPQATAKFGTVEFTYAAEENGTYTATVPTDAGTYYVKASVAESEDYTAVEKVISFVIAKADNAISDFVMADWTYGETASIPQATAKFGTVEFTYATEENGTYTATVPAEIGTYYVKASVAATNNYNAVEETLSFSIKKKKIVNEITSLTIEGWTYGETANDPQATAKNGTVEFTYATEENGTYTATVPTDAGTYYVKASVAESEDYTAVEKVISFVIAKSNNEISGLTIEGWTYGETANAPQATAKNGTVEFTYATEENGTYTATVPTDAGTYYVKASVAESANYNAVEAKTSFVIAKAVDVVGKPNVPAETITCCVGLPTSFGEISVKSGSEVTFKYSVNGTDFVDSIAASEVVAGTYYVKACSAGNANYNGGESEATEITVDHKHEIKTVEGEYKNVCACGDEIALPKVKAAFTVDGTTAYELNLDYGSKLTDEIIDSVKAEIAKKTDRKVISMDYDKTEELLADAVVEMTMDYGYMVAGSALKMSYRADNNNPYAVLDTSMTAPAGFTRVSKTTLAGTKNQAYSQLTLSKYKTIFFALKTDGGFTLDSGDAVVTDGSWMIFTVTRNQDGTTWDIVVKNETGKVLKEAQGVTADEKAAPYYKDSLSSLLWGSRGTGYNWSLSEGQSMWATEIRADRIDEQRAASFGTEVGILFDEDKLALEEMNEETAGEALVATGFEKVYKSTDAVTGYHDRALSDVDYTNYSEIRFAVMTNWLLAAASFNSGDAAGDRVGNMNWYYYTLVQSSDNTWDVTITDEGGRVLAEKKNINGIKGNYVSNSIDEVLWGMGDLFRIQNASINGLTAQQKVGNLVVYCSEVRGTLKTAE